jgi:hypothetical protein
LRRPGKSWARGGRLRDEICCLRFWRCCVLPLQHSMGGQSSGGFGPSLASQGFVTGPGTPGIVPLAPQIEGIENIVFPQHIALHRERAGYARFGVATHHLRPGRDELRHDFDEKREALRKPLDAIPLGNVQHLQPRAVLWTSRGQWRFRYRNIGPDRESRVTALDSAECEVQLLRPCLAPALVLTLVLRSRFFKGSDAHFHLHRLFAAT